MEFRLTDKQRYFINATIPFELYEKFNTTIAGQEQILKHIWKTKEYTRGERIWLMELRREYIKWKQDGSN